MTENREIQPIIPASVEEIAAGSENETIRRFSQRVSYLKKEATWRAGLGAGELFILAPMGICSVVSGSITRVMIAWGLGSGFSWYADLASWTSITAGLILAGGSVFNGSRDLNASAQARGEANILTDVLARHIIAEQTRLT